MRGHGEYVRGEIHDSAAEGYISVFHRDVKAGSAHGKCFTNGIRPHG